MYHLYGESGLYGNGVTDLITGPSLYHLYGESGLYGNGVTDLITGPSTSSVWRV